MFIHGRAPADHARLRRVVQTAFSPTRVAARRARIQELTDNVLDRALARGRLDVVNDLGAPVSRTIAAEVVGIPEAVRPQFVSLTSEFAHNLMFQPPAQRERGNFSMAALVPRLRELIAGWRARPPAQDNLLWTLERTRAEGALSEEETLAHGALFLFAGYITTQHLSGKAVRTGAFGEGGLEAEAQVHMSGSDSAVTFTSSSAASAAR